jgi:hypothetical protein
MQRGATSESCARRVARSDVPNLSAATRSHLSAATRGHLSAATRGHLSAATRGHLSAATRGHLALGGHLRGPGLRLEEVQVEVARRDVHIPARARGGLAATPFGQEALRPGWRD